jgi:hypothetical protein
MRISHRSIRRVRHTVLIAGEGDSEERFLKHIRALYTSDNQGFRVTVINAYGKGAANVVDKVVRHSMGVEYDKKAALLDNDTNCIALARSRAAAEGIELLEQSPCIEAWLLSLHGVINSGISRQHKAWFREKFHADAHSNIVLQKYFGKPFLDAARLSDRLLNQLLMLIGV